VDQTYVFGNDNLRRLEDPRLAGDDVRPTTRQQCGQRGHRNEWPNAQTKQCWLALVLLMAHCFFLPGDDPGLLAQTAAASAK